MTRDTGDSYPVWTSMVWFCSRLSLRTPYRQEDATAGKPLQSCFPRISPQVTIRQVQKPQGYARSRRATGLRLLRRRAPRNGIQRLEIVSEAEEEVLAALCTGLVRSDAVRRCLISPRLGCLYGRATSGGRLTPCPAESKGRLRGILRHSVEIRPLGQRRRKKAGHCPESV